LKAYYRGAKAANSLGKYDLALEMWYGPLVSLTLSENGLALFPATKELQQEQKLAQMKCQKAKEEESKNREQQTKEISKKKKLLSALSEKGIKRGDYLFQNLQSFVKVWLSQPFLIYYRKIKSIWTLRASIIGP
jgi:hypothetical protein